MASFKTMEDLIFLSYTSNFIDGEEFFVMSDFFELKNTCFPYEDYLTFNLNPSVCQGLDLIGKRDIPMR